MPMIPSVILDTIEIRGPHADRALDILMAVCRLDWLRSHPHIFETR